VGCRQSRYAFISPTVRLAIGEHFADSLVAAVDEAPSELLTTPSPSPTGDEAVGERSPTALHVAIGE
jgi:hypothetical protein